MKAFLHISVISKKSCINYGRFLYIIIFFERNKKIRFFIKSSHKYLGHTIQRPILSTFSDDSRIKHKFIKKM